MVRIHTHDGWGMLACRRRKKNQTMGRGEAGLSVRARHIGHRLGKFLAMETGLLRDTTASSKAAAAAAVGKSAVAAHALVVVVVVAVLRIPGEDRKKKIITD